MRNKLIRKHSRCFKLNKAYFQHDMVYGKFNNLNRKTQSDKILRNKGFEIASNPKMMDIKEY